MTSLSFPDVNVWLAFASTEHIHHELARRWWNDATGQIAFSRITQLGFLRLMTTAAAMDGKPLSMKDAWNVHDRLFDDERVVFLPEPRAVESGFRRHTSGAAASPKTWADAWLLAFAEAAGGTVITLDRALAHRGAHSLLA